MKVIHLPPDYTDEKPSAKKHSKKLWYDPRVQPTTRIFGLNPNLVVSRANKEVAVWVADDSKSANVERAQLIASQLQLDLVRTKAEARGKYSFLLGVDSTKIFLQPLATSEDDYESGPLFANFVETADTIHRRYLNKRTPLVRAITLPNKPLKDTIVLDGTGGLGVDAFIVASLGAQVTVLERSPIIYTLLKDGLNIAVQYEHLKDIIMRIRPKHIDFFDYLPTLSENERPDIIYLDPMYPSHKKVKRVPRKGMMITRKLIGPNPEALQMVELAQSYARYRVVLKRPYYVPLSPKAVRAYKTPSVRWEIFNTNTTNDALSISASSLSSSENKD
jgi:16S rRNA (guanine1516-N2)-methyltransferase